MEADLHYAVCETYTQAILKRRAQREAFEPPDWCASGIQA